MKIKWEIRVSASDLTPKVASKPPESREKQRSDFPSRALEGTLPRF